MTACSTCGSARDVEIVVVDAMRGFGNGWLLPAGPLREDPARRRTREHDGADRPRRRPRCTAVSSQLAAGAVHMSLDGGLLLPLNAVDGARVLADFAGPRVHAVAGIGNPERFFAEPARRRPGTDRASVPGSSPLRAAGPAIWRRAAGHHDREGCGKMPALARPIIAGTCRSRPASRWRTSARCYGESSWMRACSISWPVRCARARCEWRRILPASVLVCRADRLAFPGARRHPGHARRSGAAVAADRSAAGALNCSCGRDPGALRLDATAGQAAAADRRQADAAMGLRARLRRAGRRSADRHRRRAHRGDRARLRGAALRRDRDGRHDLGHARLGHRSRRRGGAPARLARAADRGQRAGRRAAACRRN